MTKIVVVSGLSGSGKTLALRALEDMGYFAIDNLPVPLITPFIELLDRGDGGGRGAVVVDIREHKNLDLLPESVADLRGRAELALTVLFLEASDSTLVRRFQASRRPHPLGQADQIPLDEAIRRERDLVARVRAMSDQVIATDDLSPHDLRRLVQDAVSEEADRSRMHCQVISFGFKYGSVRDADMVFDVRFLPNPYFVDDLKHLSGRDSRIVEYLEAQPDFGEYMRRLEDLIGFTLPRVVHEGKSYLTIAVGCTGGRHRSVAIGERLARFITEHGFPVTLQHRDLIREEGGRA